jgi:BirA family biotin operon repressor/biotin-[acetyl-CoA-carboxylase] ligase
LKAEILQILRDESGPFSGQAISRHLGVSRVSVWKHIKKLRELGYEIESGPSGYRLLEAPDALYPWEFPGREDRVHYAARVASTMAVARELARGGCDHLTLVLADEQTQGRGRLERIWQSALGGLYFTMVLRPDIAPLEMFRLNFAASLSLAETLQAHYGLDAGLKWPNDVLVSGAKICGMLLEMEAEADAVHYVNVGMGINVNNDPGAEVGNATSVCRLLGRTVPRRELLIAFLDRFESRLSSGLASVVDEWRRRAVTLQRRVRIVTVRESVEGTAVDVDQNGALVLRLPDGSLTRVIYGDCFHMG